MFTLESLTKPDALVLDQKRLSLDFENAFDPDILSEAGSLAISKLKAHIANSTTRGLKLCAPDQLMKEVIAFAKKGDETDDSLNLRKLEDIIDLYIETGIPVYSTGYMGRQFSGVIPIAGATDLLTSMMSQPASFYESAQLPSIVEQVMAEELGAYVGWEKDTFGMITTSGGSLANLTAILTAKNHKKILQLPLVNNKSKKNIPAIAVSADIHYSVSRSAGILGIGSDQVVSLPVNEQGQICLAQIAETLEGTEQKGLQVFCLIASAGSTAVGAIDPLEQLAILCKQKGYWFHVDGAHGASLLASDRLKTKLKGIEQADSFTWDMHKMMFVPAACTLLFYRNKDSGNQTFHQEASYIFDEETYDLDGGEKCFECTKRPMIMNLWIPWVLYGKELFERKIETLCELTTQAYHQVNLRKDFESVHTPQTNILCFKYLPEIIEQADFQMAIRNSLKEEGTFFISKVDINGETMLRVVFMNHLITMTHFNDLLDEIVRVAKSLIAETHLVEII